MVSEFQNRELGFSFEPSSEQIVTVNSFWQSTRPRKEGFWVYNHMVLQVECCADAFKVLFPTCHDHPEGLVVGNMQIL